MHARTTSHCPSEVWTLHLHCRPLPFSHDTNISKRKIIIYQSGSDLLATSLFARSTVSAFFRYLHSLYKYNGIYIFFWYGKYDFGWGQGLEKRSGPIHDQLFYTISLVIILLVVHLLRFTPACFFSGGKLLGRNKTFVKTQDAWCLSRAHFDPLPLLSSSRLYFRLDFMSYYTRVAPS